MKPLSPDTNEKVEQFQISLIRKASIYQRLQMVNSLTQTVRHLSWRGICERFPHETYKYHLERFIFLLYGDESLAQKVMNHVNKRNMGK